MFAFFPTATDAPIYHWPFATGGLILLNVVIAALQLAFPEDSQWFILQYGTINPITWFSSICMHGSIGHLIGNMVMLLLYGWIIEGKIGWWRFILIYFAIGVSACGVEQVLMFFSEGTSLGASGVVYGLIAMGMIWAPENQITMAYVGVFFYRPFWGSFNVSVMNLGFFSIAMQFVIAALTMFHMSSAVMHLMGAVPGFVIAVLMIKLRQVDCDGYDFFSTWNGTEGKRVLTVKQEKEAKAEAAKSKLDRQRLITDGLEKVDQYVNAGHYEMALKRFAMLHKKKRSLKMTEQQLVKIVKAFEKDPEKKSDAAAVIETYLEHYDSCKIPFSLILARTRVLVQDRPRAGMKVLKSLDWAELNPKQKEFVRKLIERAKRMIADGVLEVDV